jgi:hypothetical protein
MFDINSAYLLDLRLGDMTPGDRDRLIAQIKATLQQRIADFIESQLDEQSRVEYEQAVNQNDDAALEQWVMKRYPDFEDLVHDELAQIKGEIKNEGGISNPADPMDFVAEEQAPQTAPPQAQAPVQQPQAPASLAVDTTGLPEMQQPTVNPQAPQNSNNSNPNDTIKPSS